MKRFGVTVLLGAAVLLAASTGCSVEGVNDTPSPRSTPAATGSVAGTFRVDGGPDPGIDKSLSGTVTFDDGRGTEEVTTPDGTFALELLTGTYTVTGQPHAGRFAPTTCPSETVTVVADQVTTVEVSCVFE